MRPHIKPGITDRMHCGWTGGLAQTCSVDSVVQKPFLETRSERLSLLKPEIVVSRFEVLD